jgi:hypothetical protein
MKKINRKNGMMVASIMVIVTIILGIGPMVNASTYHNGTAPEDLEISSVIMDDYSIICAYFGGQDVNIGTWVYNSGDTTFEGEITIYYYINELDELVNQTFNVEIPASDDELYRTSDVHIEKPLGEYELWSYVEDDDDCANYCEFDVTFLGLD